jgi:Flp pilus assembly protein protease CpaA
MVLGWILLSIGVAGFSLGAWWDLKTTEFPDWLPYSIIVMALGVRGTFAFLYSDLSILTSSVLTGLLFLGFGLALYYTKQWGDGDAWLLGGLGFLFPAETGFAPSLYFPFPVTMLFNFFVIAFIYLILYSFGMGMRSRQLSRRFFVQLRGELKGIGKITLAFTAAVAAFVLSSFYLFGLPHQALWMAAFSPLILLSILFFIRYGRFIESEVFKRKVPVSKLREGDVLASDRWRGLTKKDISRMQKTGGSVEIKEGVRFAPVFVITLLVTLFFGNVLFLFI